MLEEQKQKLIAILDYCNEVDCKYDVNCKEHCKIHSVCKKCNGDFQGKPECIDLAYEIITNNEENLEDLSKWICTGNTHAFEIINDSDKALVEHPKHYNRENAVECIEEMIDVFGIEKTMNFCLLNVWKYRYRAADKNGIQDLNKSDWYMKKYLELKKVIKYDE